jgi:non-specific serine/threonine protein kinase/serine/threonine-protein kinase
VKPERWRQVEGAFERLLELPADARPAALERVCGCDEELHREVSSLLAAHAEAGAFIDSPELFFSREALGAVGDTLAPGQPIGRYRVVREIGRGGMGAVYLAERADSQFEQRVAVKLIKRGMDTDAVLRHFRNERQILAGFDHPHIARLLDGGTTDAGLPYFVMEYVEGVPVDAYCDAHALPVTERLKLFREVCAAVAYAHRHLVVHRDIKPSNILVTADGVPKLLDFGIAKILQPGGGLAATATATGLRLMTPEYASPEQARGLSVTTVSDVYSLGVVLYELLTGHPPHRLKSRAPDEVARALNETEPPRPSTVINTVEVGVADGAGAPDASTPESISRTREGTPERLRRRLRGDLDNIVLTALRKEPGRRYQSVEQFSEDIRRHLEGLPVLARGDTLAYRGAKFVRRNKAAVAAATLVLLSLVFGVVATTLQARRARAAQARAERRFSDVRRLANAVLFDYHDAIRDLPGATPVRERLVRDALAYLDSLATEAGDDPALQRELAAAYDRVGDVRGQVRAASLGDAAGAMESYLKALRIREALVAADPRDAQNRRDLAASLRKIGNQLTETSEAARGAEHLRRSLALYRELAAEQPSHVEALYELAEIYNDVGLASEGLGDMAGALEQHREALALREKFAAADPQNREHRRNLSVTYENIGRALFLRDDTAGALENNRRALALREALSAEDPTSADYRRLLAVSYQNNGDFLAWLKDTRGALESFRTKFALDEASLAADPANAQARLDLGYSSQRIGDLLSELGDYSRALPHYRRALVMWEKLAAGTPVDLTARLRVGNAHATLGRAHAKLGSFGPAREECRQALNLLRETVDDPANVDQRRMRILAYTFLGEAYATLAADRRAPAGSTAEYWRAARDAYRQSLDIMRDLRDRP